jgi:hypothetical protein
MSRVPLFVEAMMAAFHGTADVQPISADDVEAHGLLRAFRPDAVIVEGVEPDAERFAAPCLHVDLTTQEVSARDEMGWRTLKLEPSPESIRNTLIALLYGGDPA